MPPEIDGSDLGYKWIDSDIVTAQGQLRRYWLKFIGMAMLGFAIGIAFTATFGFLFAPPSLLMCAASVSHRNAVLKNSIPGLRLPLFFSLWATLWICAIIYFYGLNIHPSQPWSSVFLDNSFFAIISATPPIMLYIFVRLTYKGYKKIKRNNNELTLINYDFRPDLLSDD